MRLLYLRRVANANLIKVNEINNLEAPLCEQDALEVVLVSTGVGDDDAVFRDIYVIERCCQRLQNLLTSMDGNVACLVVEVEGKGVNHYKVSSVGMVTFLSRLSG